MKKSFLKLVALLMSSSVSVVVAGTCDMEFPDPNWAYTSSASVGMNQARVGEFLAKMQAEGSHTDAIVIRNGKIIASTGSPGRYADWASATKIWLSALVVMMVQDGSIGSFDEKINFPGLLGKDQGITWRQLMLMTSGYANSELPGTRFAYNDRAISLLIAALKRRLGDNLTSAIKLYFSDLDLTSSGIIEDSGRSTASLYDYAKLLQLLLNEGSWKGKRLISKEILSDAFGTLAVGPVSSSASEYGGYLDIVYMGGRSNQTRETGAGPGEYVFNGWLNTRSRFGMPADFFQGNGHWGRAVAGFSPSLRLIVVVRIDDYFPSPKGQITSGIIVEHLPLLAEAVDVACTNSLTPPNITPILMLLLG